MSLRGKRAEVRLSKSRRIPKISLWQCRAFDSELTRNALDSDWRLLCLPPTP